MNNLKMKQLLFYLMVLVVFNYSFSQTSSSKIKVLIVDGFNNHNWQQTTFVVKTILEKSDLFEVSVSTAPSEVNDPKWNDWNPNFKKYDVVIQNTNNIHNPAIKWPVKVQKSLEKYIKKGGGLHILHSANNAFSDWPAYNEMIGLGWRTKDEGIAIQITSDKQLKYIPKGEGETTYHGPRNDQVIHILKNHPINNGFPNTWKTPNMELYKYARGTAKNITILSYAFDEKTNINWPVDWVVTYGKGRIYNSSLGHLWKDEIYPASYRCVGFQTTLIRATEWLATKNTTYKIPQNFPTENEIRLENELLNN